MNLSFHHLFKKAGRCCLLLLVILLGQALQLQAQMSVPTAKIEQSPYYDALGLYYALQGIPAYPVAYNQADNLKAAKAWKGAGAAKAFYKIIETTTGKILLDTVADVELADKFTTLKVKTDADIQPVIMSILCRNAGLDASSDWSTVWPAYQTNQYLKDLLQKGAVVSDSKSLTPDVFMGELSASDKGGGFGLGGNLLNGLAEFYVQRVNEEINAAFFVQLTKVLDKYPEIRLLFPQSYQTLSKIEVTRYQSTLNALKQSFLTDIRQLPGNLPKLATIKRYSDLIDKHNELMLLFAGCDIVYQVNQRIVPAEILQRMDTASYMTKTKPNTYRAVIQMAALTSYCLRDIRIGDQSKEGKGWVALNQITLFKKNAAFFKIFMGLYTQNASGITFTTKDGTAFDFKAALNANADDVLKGQYLIYNFSQLQNTIVSAFNNLETVDTVAQKKLSACFSIAQQLISLSQTTAGILPSKISGGFIKATTDFQNDFLPLARRANDLMADITTKNYSQAVFKADTLLGTIFDFWQQYDTSLQGKDKDVKKIVDDHADVRRYFLKYGSFIASVAAASKPEDVKDALNAFALPTGSSRIKKETNFSFGINSYVGFYHAWNKQTNGTTIPSQETGLTVPMGFAFNKGHFLGGSLSAYVGVIDIGAIFSYQVTANAEVKSDIQFSQILSPSVGLVYGLPILSKFNIPLSIGANMQWGPKLKGVGDTGNSVLSLMNKHNNIFIAVDIPIINFYTSKK